MRELSHKRDLSLSLVTDCPLSYESCSVLQCVAVCCSVLQCVAVCSLVTDCPLSYERALSLIHSYEKALSLMGEPSHLSHMTYDL